MGFDTTITFAGQAGFIFKSKTGFSVGVDLYLSDCCNRYFGFKRLMTDMFNPIDLNLDIIVTTHAHYDHFDPDSIPLVMSSSGAELVCAYDVKPEVQRLGLEESRVTYLKEGDKFTNDYVSITAYPCDHGEETPEAIGIIMELDGKKIYVTGDTCYREEYFADIALENTDVMILPINGAFGNLNEVEAADAVNIVKPSLAIPCHYWNFAQHGGNPDVFVKQMQNKYSNDNFILMRPGETIIL